MEIPTKEITDGLNSPSEILTNQTDELIAYVIEYLEREIDTTKAYLDANITNSYVDIQFWKGHINGTENALSLIRWYLKQ